MIKIIKTKWFKASSPFEDRSSQVDYCHPEGHDHKDSHGSANKVSPLQRFYLFLHTSPYILFMVDRIHDLIHNKLNNVKAKGGDPFTDIDDELDLKTKICLLYEVFAHNKVNILQI